MITKTFKASFLLFTLGLLMGSALTTSVQAMEKEEPAEKSLNQIRQNFLNDLGERVIVCRTPKA